MNTEETILIVDDDARVLETLDLIFKDDYQVILSRSGAEALELIKARADIDAIVLDIKMASMNGLQTATAINEINSDIPIIFHTGYPGEFSEEEIEKDFQPYDYVGKDERPARLRRAVRQAVTFSRYKRQSVNLVEHAKVHFGIIGCSKAMLEVYQTIEQIGPTDNSVMVFGSTGTGKELVARAIHKMSTRADKQLVISNCNHRTPDLVETELFGYVKGAFTGADKDRIGLFEYADSGTLFLDEVGDLDISTQGRLLRVLESGEMTRVGSPETIKVDVRVVCATHRDLSVLVKDGNFREDIYYRLQGVSITLPDLKDRPDDIPLLIDHFIDVHCAKRNIGRKVFEPSARNLLVSHDWPGNVRFLMKTIQALIDMTPSQFITSDDTAKYLKIDSFEKNGQPASLSDQVRDFKRRLLIGLMDNHKGNVNAVARELSVDPSNLRKLLKDLGL